MGVRLAAFNLPSIAKLTMTDELHLQELGERKIALFCCIPDSDKSLNYLVGMIYTQLIQTLYRQADRIHKGRLPVPVHCLMDEYANISLPKDTFLSALATMRSRAIFCSIIVQNMAQLYQKTYTTDSLPLKRYLNTGQRSKYYAMETHEGIISKTDYEKVQNLLAKKSITGEIDRTCVFSKKIYCSICGAICSRKGPPTQGFVWCCRTHLQSKALCLLKSIREDELQQAFLSIYNRLQCNQKTILEPLVDDLLGLRHLQEQKYKKRLALGEDIQHLAKQKHNLTRIHTLGYIEEPQFIERSAAIEQQIRERKQQLSRNDMSNTSEKILQKTRLIQKKLSSTPPLELFDESVFKELVKKVLISNTAIQFELINGMKLSESRAAT